MPLERAILLTGGTFLVWFGTGDLAVAGGAACFAMYLASLISGVK